jgi:site-specific DNA recombinase
MKEMLPCAIYTRKSSEEGLDQGFNSLDAQREACEAYIFSQKALGWEALEQAYDDGGFSGGNTERPGLKKLLADIALGKVKIVIVYKVDRLTRSLADFAKLVELFDAHGVSFVSVTQQFNTTSSMGRLTLNVLLSFAQFEREVTGERIRDKIAASKRKGMWMGGSIPIGYIPHERTLKIDEQHAKQVCNIYQQYLELGCVRQLKIELDQQRQLTPIRTSQCGGTSGGRPFSRGNLYRILSNPIYIGQIVHKEAVFPGQHPAIIDTKVWQSVQDKMMLNRQGHRTRQIAINPSLLTGLIFDEHGNRLTPSHSKKGARRYRYYINQQYESESEGKSSDILRLPAQELEAVVIQALTGFLKDESRLLGFMGAIEAGRARHQLQAATELAKQLLEGNASQKINILQRLLSRITIYKHKLEIAIIRVQEWNKSHTNGTKPDELLTVIEVPVELKRCGMAVRLIVRATGATACRVPDKKLIARIAKAYTWFQYLSSGRFSSIQAIALQEKVTSSYVTRVIHLAFLAPDIVQRIINGDHPIELNIDRLIRMVPLPMNWAAQRELLGMS